MNIGRQNDLRFVLIGGDALGPYMPFNVFNGGRLDSDGSISLTGSAGGFR